MFGRTGNRLNELYGIIQDLKTTITTLDERIKKLERRPRKKQND